MGVNKAIKLMVVRSNETLEPIKLSPLDATNYNNNCKEVVVDVNRGVLVV